MTRELTEEQYARRIDRLYDLVFRQRMVDLLQEWKHALTVNDYTVSGPHDMTGDEYCWYLAVEGNGLGEPVDVSLEFSESASYGDGTEGAAFGIEIVAHSGRIIGGMQPFNYTDECWVPVNRPRELSDRLAMIEQADVGDGIALIDDFRSVSA